MKAAGKEYGQEQNQEKEPCKEKPGKCVGNMYILHLGHHQTAVVWQKDSIFNRKKEQSLKHTGSWDFL